MLNKPIKKKKVCKEEDCESEYIFSKGYCKHHSQLNKLKESKKKARVVKSNISKSSKSSKKKARASRNSKSKLMSISNLDKLVWKITSLAFRIDDADNMGYVKCCTCNIKHYYYKSSVDCGHFISRSKKNTKFLRKNNSAQCKSCNSYGSGEQYKHSIYLNNRWGEGTADEMLKLSNSNHKFSREDYKLSLIENAKLLMKVSKEKSLWDWRDSLTKWQNDFLDNLENIDINKELTLNKQKIC